MIYQKHVFVCINEREDKTRKSCGKARGMALVEAFKEGLKKRKLNVLMRAQKTGCFDLCAYGPTVAVYPEGIFYGKVQPEDVDEIIEEHLINDRPVDRLMIRLKKKNQ